MWALSCSRAVSGSPPVGFDADNWLSILVSHRRKSSISPWKPWACSGTQNQAQMTSATIDHAPGLTQRLLQNQIKRQSWRHQGGRYTGQPSARVPGPCPASEPSRTKMKVKNLA